MYWLKGELDVSDDVIHKLAEAGILITDLDEQGDETIIRIDAGHGMVGSITITYRNRLRKGMMDATLDDLIESIKMRRINLYMEGNGE